MFYFLFFQQFRQIKRYFSHKIVPRVITTAIFLAILGLVSFGLYKFFYRSFFFISGQYFFGQALQLYVLEMFFAVISGLALAGSLISFWLWMFRGVQQAWVVSGPNYSKLPLLIFSRVFVYNSWPLLVIVLPMLFALRNAFAISWLYLFLGFFSTILLFLIISALAQAIVLGSAIILHKVIAKKFSMKFLAWFVGFCLFALSAGAFWNFTRVDLPRRFSAQDLAMTQAPAERIASDFYWLPSHPTAQFLWNVSYGKNLKNLEAFVYSLTWLSIFSAACLFLNKKFLVLWQALQDQADIQRRFSKPSRLILASKNPTLAIIGKELVLSFRNQKNLLWLLFMGLIWALQSGTTFMIARNLQEYELILPKLPARIYGLQIAMAVFFVTSLCLRFAFPSFSSEGKTLWLLGSAPISLRKIFFSKLLFFAPFAALSGLVLSIANTKSINIGIANSTLFLLVIVVCSLSIASFAVSLGAKFANFSTDDPQILSTTLPGLFYTFFSLGFGGFAAWAFYEHLLPESKNLYLNLFWVLSLVLTFIFVYFASKSLKNKEFISQRE